MNEIRIGHLEVDSPFGNAGGVVKSIEDVEVMARTGVGWIEAGSYTLEKRLGNAWNPDTGVDDRIVYHHNPITGETTNSIGMKNSGLDVVETEIPEMVRIAESFGKPLMVNIAPVGSDPVAESLELVTRAYEAGASGVILNAGCPNVVTEDGGRHEILSHNEAALHQTLAGLETVVSKFHKVFVRVSPQHSQGACLRVIKAMEHANTVGAVFTPNTWPGHRPVDEYDNPILEVPGNMGGLSGPATAEKAAQQTEWFALQSIFAVVSSGGIVNGKELHKRMYSPDPKVGHIAVAGAATTFFYESGDWRHDVDKLIWEYQDSVENNS